MARTSNADRVRVWVKRLHSAEKLYKQWHDEYDCDKLEAYYLNDQKLNSDDKGYKINLFYSKIEARKAALLFHGPRVVITPRAAKSDDPGVMIDERVRLMEDTAQTFILDRRLGFMEQASLALHESFFRFGVFEVGYTADFMDNPNAGRPMLKEDSEDPLLDAEGKEVPQPEKNLVTEQVFFRHIPAKQFRVSVKSVPRLEWNDWVGYYEWVQLEDVKRNPRYSNTTNIKGTGGVKSAYEDPTEDSDERMAKRGLVKLWKVWDLRAKKKYVFLEEHDKFLIDGEPYEYLPFAVLRYHQRLDSFYPMPPTAPWLDVQNEYNETREQLRVQRRRDNRLFLVRKGAIDPQEMKKIEAGEDGTYAWTDALDAVAPVPLPTSSATAWRNVPTTKDDFREISAVSGEATGVADTETATQASIMDQRLQLRESRERLVIAEWLADVVMILLKTLRDKMALPFWVQTNVDLASPGAMQEAQRVAATYQQIMAADLGEFEFDVGIDVESMAPVNREEKMKRLERFLAMATQPPVLAMLGSSEPLLRRVLEYLDIRGSKEIAELQLGVRTVAGIMFAPQQPQGGGASPAPPPTPGGPAPADQISNQLQGQVGPQGVM